MIEHRSCLGALTALLLCGLAFLSSTAAADDGITDLDPAFSYGSPMGLSGDGSVIVFAQAFWRASTGSFTTLSDPTGQGSITATAISGNGAYAVGYDNLSGLFQAVRWNLSTNTFDPLGQLVGGFDSQALGINNDGSVIVGWANINSSDYHAFRWTQAAGFQDLGTLGGTYSWAKGVSGDGSVVVGLSDDSLAQTRAFRWTPGAGGSGTMVALTTLGGAETFGGSLSVAYAVSRDGNVIVGKSNDSSGNMYAFRWTSLSGMVSLGALSYTGPAFSIASAANANGSVIIGQSQDQTGSGRGFRWTQASGMITVEQWLRNGGVTVPTDTTLDATGVSDDGNVIVGYLQNNHAYIARLTPAGGGMIDVPVFMAGVAEAGRLQAQVAANGNLVLHGMHGAPMRNLPTAGQRTAWASGDFGRATHGDTDADLVSGEAGVAYGLGKGLVAKFAAGRSYERAAFSNDGSSTARGTFVLPEFLASVTGTPLWMSLSGYANFGDADVKRGYLNAGVVNVARGETDTRVLAFRARVDALDAATVAGVSLTPYASLSRVYSKSDAYTEEGGAFPIHADARSEVTTESRVGLDAATPLFERATLLARAEWVHRFDDKGADISGDIIGLNGFHLDGVDYKQDWARFGLGAEINVGEGLVSFMLNATTEGEAPSAWLYSGYSVAF